jgi:N-acetylmuramate 1-kinase
MTDERRRQAEQWAAERLQWDDFESTSVSSDASFRRYYRLAHEDRTVIVMDAPPEHENIDTFIDIGQRLEQAGIHAPHQIHADRRRGFLLLDDLGNQPYHQILDDDNADALFHDAVEALIAIQTRTRTSGLPYYDAGLLMRELSLFPDWFLARHWQVEPTDGELDAWDLVCATLIRWALDQPQVFCHRDFMPRNLMLANPNPGVIDFQDAVVGPISYDPVCLYRDAFLSWPTQRVDEWLEAYRLRALDAGLPVPESADLWRRTCDLMGVQRHLKVIGIFARIRYRDGKPRYLDDAPRFFIYLDEAIARNPELAELDRLLASWQARRRKA